MVNIVSYIDFPPPIYYMCAACVCVIVSDFGALPG